MKKFLLLTTLGCLLVAQTTSSFADSTSAQKEQIERARTTVREVIKTEAGCKAMCEEMMANKKAKKTMCEMMKCDPESMKMMKTK